MANFLIPRGQRHSFVNEPVKCFFSAECVRKEKEGTFERFLFKGAPCHLKVLLLCTWRDEARYQGWVVKKKREWIREGGGRRCKFKTGVWGFAGEGGGWVRRISIGHAAPRQPATVRSRRKIREGISVISSRRVMVRARFKAGAKNVSASQPPPSHHPACRHPPT